jgi:hypothetical protein
LGFNIHGEYFDCELDVGKSTTLGRAFVAFTPYNKNPKNLWTTISMGMRQVRAFFIYFPKAEKCGAMFRWSQSINNPVKVRKNYTKQSLKLVSNPPTYLS